MDLMAFKNASVQYVASGNAAKHLDHLQTGHAAIIHGSNVIAAMKQENKSIREKIGDVAGHADQLLAVAASVPIIGEIPDAIRLGTSAVHVLGSKDVTTALQRATQHAASIAVDAVPGADLVNGAAMLVTKDHKDLATTLAVGITGGEDVQGGNIGGPGKTPGSAVTKEGKGFMA